MELKGDDNMNNIIDESIHDVVKKIRRYAITYDDLVTDINEMSFTDRILEEIIELGDELKELYERRFEDE